MAVAAIVEDDELEVVEDDELILELDEDEDEPVIVAAAARSAKSELCHHTGNPSQ
jgi:hypothetical protein